MARGRLRGLCVMLENTFTHLLHSTSIKVMPENYFTHIVWFTWIQTTERTVSTCREKGKTFFFFCDDMHRSNVATWTCCHKSSCRGRQLPCRGRKLARTTNAHHGTARKPPLPRACHFTAKKMELATWRKRREKRKGSSFTYQYIVLEELQRPTLFKNECSGEKSKVEH